MDGSCSVQWRLHKNSCKNLSTSDVPSGAILNFPPQVLKFLGQNLASSGISLTVVKHPQTALLDGPSVQLRQRFHTCRKDEGPLQSKHFQAIRQSLVHQPMTDSVSEIIRVKNTATRTVCALQADNILPIPVTIHSPSLFFCSLNRHKISFVELYSLVTVWSRCPPQVVLLY